MIMRRFCVVDIKLLLETMKVYQKVGLYQTREFCGRIFTQWEMTSLRDIKAKSVFSNYGSFPNKFTSSKTYFCRQYLSLSSKFTTKSIPSVPVLLTNNQLLRQHVSYTQILSDFKHRSAHHSSRITDKDISSFKEAEKELTSGRLAFLSKNLKCSFDETKKMVDKYTFFLHLNPELILEKIAVMQSYSLPISFISRNPRLLYQHSSDELKRRLQLLKEATLLTENPIIQQQDLAHYLECPYKTFDHSFKRLCAERDALEGCWSQKDYLQLRLQCSQETAETLLSQSPLKNVVSNVKLKQFLDFMLNEAKFSPEFVIQHRQLMSFSLDRLKFRWHVMQAAGVSASEEMVYVWKLAEQKFTIQFEAYI
ncbi:unnamed protein product [Lymnaea stagnalis]|uniref:Uncharacterized protein n=1 Tax=Lymnaea stagnalis TaxID=6523 RepID=A0AAV2HXY5_LYMST